MARELTFRIFIGDRPMEDLTAEERKLFAERCGQRMADALSDHYTVHPEEYIKVPEIKP